MAKRILPYRDYSEHEVVNLFALDTAGLTLSSCVEAGSGDWDSGVVVKVNAGELPGDVPGKLDSASGDKLRDYLGASFSSAHIGFNAYPSNGMTVTPAAAGEVALGITLRETLAFDENGEKLLYYKQKLEEAQAVLPGQTVPVLTRGMVLLGSSAFASAPSVGDKLQISGTDGKLEGDASGTLGQVIAKSGTDKFLCKVSF